MVAGRQRRGRAAALLLVGSVCAMPAAAGASVRDLVEITDFTGLAASPDGKFAVFRTETANLEQNRYELQWHSVDLSSGRVRDIGNGGDPIYGDPGLLEPGEPMWTAGSRTILFKAYVGGAVGIFQARVDGRRSLPLVVGAADVEKPELSRDRAALLYETGPTRAEIERAEKREYDEGILVDRTVDLAQNLYRGGSVEGRMATQRLTGYWFMRSGLTSRWPRQKHWFELATGRDELLGKPRPVPPFTPPNAVDASATAADGAVAEARSSGNLHSITAQLPGSPPRRCLAAACRSGHVSWLAWRPATAQVLIAVADPSRRQSLVLWDVDSGKVRTVATSDGLLSGSRWPTAPCAVTRDSALCVAASAASAPRLERISLDDGARTILFDPNKALRAGYRPRLEFLDWPLGKDRVSAVLLSPAGAGASPLPLFVNYYHCDGFLRGGEGDAWPTPQLVAAGFAVACINLVPFSGTQDAVATYHSGLSAVRSLVAMLRKRGIVDRRKVAMGGFSFGSEVAIWTAMKSRLLAAMSIASAQAEPAGYWFDTLDAPDRARMTRSVWHLGAPDETPRRWKAVSPALNTDRISIPVLFQLPEQEARRIPELYARLRADRTPAELYAFPDEDHLIVQPRHRLAIYQRNLDWLRYWLQGFRDPDPAKADQYARWDRLRQQWRPESGKSSSAAKAQARPSR